MDVRQLEYLLVIEKHGSISAAAEEIHISQSALSQSLQKAEKQLGFSLFQRVDKKMVPTKAGNLYLTGAKEMVRVKKDTYAKIDELVHQKKNTLSLSMTPQVYQHSSASIIRKCQEVFGDAMIQELKTDVAREYLNNDLLDAAIICFNGKPDSALTIHRLYEEEIILAVPESYSWDGIAVDPEALRHCPFSAIQETGFFYSLLEPLFSDPCFTASIDYRVESLTNIRTLVENGYSAAFVPGRMAEIMKNCRLYPWHSRPKYEIALAFSKYSAKKEQLRELKQLLTDLL